jgi:hypothetical protein
MSRSIRGAFVAAWLLWAAVASAQDTSKRISYTTVAVPAWRALSELSTSSGVQLEATPQTANDVVVIRVKDAPLSAVMKQLAACINAEWERTNSGYRLTRPQRLEVEEQRRELQATAAAFAKHLKNRAAALEKQGGFDEAKARNLNMQLDDFYRRSDPYNPGSNWEQYSSISEKMPAARMAARIALAMDPMVLASIPAEQRVVFSSSPTKMQQKLPAQALATLSTFVKEQAVWAEEMKRNPPVQSNWYIGGATSVEAAPAKVLVSVTRYGRNAQVQVNIYDAKGMMITSAGSSLSVDWRAMMKEANDAAQRDTGKAEIKYSPLTLKLRSFFGPQPDSKAPEMDAELREAILHPESRDPLSFGTSEGLIGVGEIRGENVIASVPDALISGNYWSSEMKSPSAFLASMRSYLMDYEEADGWLVVRPIDAATARKSRLDRRALGNFLRNTAKNGSATLEENAAYALSIRVGHNDVLTPSMLRLVSADTSAVNYFGTLDVLRLYGTLSASQRQELLSPAGMSLRRLTPQQRGYVEYLAYSNEYSVQFQPREAPQDSESQMIYWNGIMREPTESLPNGIPSTGTLKMTDTTDRVVFLGKQPADSWMSGRALSASELAWQMFSQEREDLFPWVRQTGQRAVVDKVRVGSRRRLVFNFQMTDVLVMNHQLMQNEPSASAAVTLDQLPADIKKEFDEHMANFAKQYKDAKPGQYSPLPGVNKNIPPTS